jgi:UDP-3-O-[3-hydroxymyristoyl] glucosamine N-acyltransferase
VITSPIGKAPRGVLQFTVDLAENKLPSFSKIFNITPVDYMGFRPIKRGVLLSEIVSKVEGEAIGDTSCNIEGLCSMDEPRDKHLSLFTGDSVRELSESLKKGGVSAVFVKSKLNIELIPGRTIIKVKSPIAALVATMEFFYSKIPVSYLLSEKAAIDPSAQLGKNVAVGAFSVIGENVEVGDDSIIHPNVVIYRDVKIGKGVEIHAGAIIREGSVLSDSCVIQNGAVIGADGFGYFFDGTKLAPVPQVGIVHLAAGVEVGANTCVDRATLGATKIGLGTKIDNLVQIGHNVQIGAMSILCGQVGVGGSSKIGNGVTLGGQSGVADHAIIPDKSRFAAQAGAIGHYQEAGDYAGMPAIPAGQWRRITTSLMKLPKLLSKINDR